jgi:chromosome segregation ATPase
MAIPAVVQGTVETEDGKVFEVDSPKGVAWVESIGSFRFEPAGDGKPCTIRKEPSGYWYGCRKVAGKVRKKYIGKSSEINTAKLEGIAAALEVPPVQRVNKVAEVVQGVAEVTQDRLTALELEVASLRKALEALQEALPGKLELGDSAELPKVDSEVAEQLQKRLCNLKTENETLRQELADATAANASQEKEIAEVRSQRDEAREELFKREDEVQLYKLHTQQLRSQLVAANQKISDLDVETSAQLKALMTQDGEITILKSSLARLARENSEKSVAASELPEAAELLNQLKAKRKKSSVTLADVEKILEIIEGTSNE